jgi:hypothetical protein
VAEQWRRGLGSSDSGENRGGAQQCAARVASMCPREDARWVPGLGEPAEGRARRWPRLRLLRRAGMSAKARSGGGVLHNPVGTSSKLRLGGRPRRRRDSAAQCGGSRGSACSGEPAVRPGQQAA